MRPRLDIGEVEHQSLLARLTRDSDRRTFLKWTGAAGATLVLANCADDEPSPVAPGAVDRGGLTAATHFLTPKNDTEILQFALLLELLEARFYQLALRSGILEGKVREVTRNVAKHEADHVAFLQKALGEAGFGQEDVEFNFGNSFRNQNKYLDTAQAFEQTGVGAYLGALPLIKSPAIAAAAGSIFTIEARHTAAFRALNRQGIPVPLAFEQPLSAAQVVDRVSPFIVSLEGTP